MIPIECPKCGRGGNVPPDRLNARLVCKACHSVFHMDNSGKLMLGEPGVPDRKANRQADAARSSAADIDLAETFRKIPAPVKYGIPAAALAAILWMNFGPGPGEPDYIKSTERLIQAIIANDRSQVVSSATAGSADAAGKWFDMVHDAFTKKNVTASYNVIPTLWSGDPTKSSDIQMAVIVADPETSEQFPLPINIYMTSSGGQWVFDGTRTLGEAEKMFTTQDKKASR